MLLLVVDNFPENGAVSIEDDLRESGTPGSTLSQRSLTGSGPEKRRPQHFVLCVCLVPDPLRNPKRVGVDRCVFWHVKRSSTSRVRPLECFSPVLVISKRNCKRCVANAVSQGDGPCPVQLILKRMLAPRADSGLGFVQQLVVFTKASLSRASFCENWIWYVAASEANNSPFSAANAIVNSALSVLVASRAPLY